MVEKGFGSKEELLDSVRDSLAVLQEKYDIKPENLIDELLHPEITKIPVSCFCEELSTLEVVTLYLKENAEFSNVKIATLLDRSPKTIWQAISSAKKKQKNELLVQTSRYDIPIERFANRNMSNLENVVYYLRSKFDLKYSEIGKMLHRNERTIWTIYSRATKKIDKKK